MNNREILALGIFSSRSRLCDRIELLLRRGRTFSPKVSIVRVAVSVAALLGSLFASSLAPRLLVFAQQPAFDVVSIKLDKAPVGERGGGNDGGGYLRYESGGVVGTVTARRIIMEAYHLTDYQLSGGPGWFDNDRFDLEAKAATPANEDQLRLMLQTMLAERFNLVVRRETKEMPVYVLAVGKNGPKLPEVKPGEPAPTISADRPGREGSALHSIERFSMRKFVDRLSLNPSIDRPVLDKTGLQGIYLFLLEWNADEDFMAAVEDELGLKFESQRAPMDTLVIEHIEKPDAN